MVIFVRLDHSFNQVVENRGFALRPVEAITEFIQVPRYMLFAYPRIGTPDPGFDLVDHRVQCFKVQHIVAGYLLYLIILGERAVSTPFIRGYICLGTDVLFEYNRQ